MYTICVAALKGGVGKTTTATNIAELLSRTNRVLFVDADCQGDSSRVFCAYSEDFDGLPRLLQNGISEVKGESDLYDYMCRLSIAGSSGKMDVIPSNEWLQKVNANLMVERKMNQINILQKALDGVRSDYDYCVIDCGLQLDLAVVNAIMVSDVVLSPMKLGGFELSALERLEYQINDFRRIRPNICLRIFGTMFQNTASHREVERQIAEHCGRAYLHTHIRNCTPLMRHSFGKGTVTQNSPRCNASKDYAALLDELVGGGWRE